MGMGLVYFDSFDQFIVSYLEVPSALLLSSPRQATMPQLKLSGGDTGELSMRKIVIKYRIGSIFEKVPAETLLIHSCNSRGIWGKGVAASFKTRYPTAFETHREYCQQHDAASLIGKPMVIPPNEKNVPPGAQRHHYIGCLFVKDNIGKPRDAAEKKTIVDATKLAMQQLLDGMVEQRRQGLHHVSPYAQCPAGMV